MERVNLIRNLLVCAVVSVVPGFFVFLFASSAYRELKQRHAKWIQAELALNSAPTPKPPELIKQLEAARSSYCARRGTFWGALWGTVCRLPPSGSGGRPTA